jgi:hypothetical protein
MDQSALLLSTSKLPSLCPPHLCPLRSLKASVWKHFTTTITQQLHHLADPNYSHLHGYHPNHPSAQILNRLRAGQQSNFPRHQTAAAATATPNAGILPVPILPNGQYSQGSQVGGSRRYPIPTPVPIPIPAGSGGQQQPQQRGGGGGGRQAWEQSNMATGFAPNSLVRPGQAAQQNASAALLNATQQAYPQLVSHYFNSSQAAQASQNIATQLTNHALQLQHQQQLLSAKEAAKASDLSSSSSAAADASGRSSSVISTRQQQLQQQLLQLQQQQQQQQQPQQQQQQQQKQSQSSTSQRRNQSVMSASAMAAAAAISASTGASSATGLPGSASTSASSGNGNGNKRSMEDMKDFLALTPNQPSVSNAPVAVTGEIENFSELKRLKRENSLQLYVTPFSSSLPPSYVFLSILSLPSPHCLSVPVPNIQTASILLWRF